LGGKGEVRSEGGGRKERKREWPNLTIHEWRDEKLESSVLPSKKEIEGGKLLSLIGVAGEGKGGRRGSCLSPDSSDEGKKE